MKRVIFVSLIVFFYSSMMAQHIERDIKDSTLIQVSKDAGSVVETLPTGAINWTEQYVEAKGWSAMDTSRFKVPGQAELMARTGAIAIAQRNLLEIVQGVRIVSEVTVRDCVPQNDYVYKRLDGLCKGAEMVGEPVVNGNIVEVTMRIPLYESTEKQTSVAEIVRGTATNIVEKKKTEIKNELPTINTKSTRVSSTQDSSSDQDTSVVSPSLFPVVFDSTGNVIFDYSSLFNPNKGNFPKYYKATRTVAESLNNDTVDKVLNATEVNGKVIIDPGQESKFNKWMNIGEKVLKVGSMLMMFL